MHSACTPQCGLHVVLAAPLNSTAGDHVSYIHERPLATILHGLRGYALHARRTVRLRITRLHHPDVMNHLARRVADAMRKHAHAYTSHVVIFYGPAPSADHSQRINASAMSNAAAAQGRVLLVQYQTEPVANATTCARRAASRRAENTSPQRAEPILCETSRSGQYGFPVLLGARELWDFSLGNVQNYRESAGTAYDVTVDRTFRYVPLGALPDEQPQAVHTSTPSLTFFGQLRWYQHRREMWHLVKKALGKRAHDVNDVSDERAFAKLLTTASLSGGYRRFRVPPASIFLNMHKHGGREGGARPVTFRVAKLLDAGALVISERCHPDDEAEFAGVVDFVEEAEVLASFLRLANASATHRHALAAERRERFRERFEPRGIFERAGIYVLFDSLLNCTACADRGTDSVLT